LTRNDAQLLIDWLCRHYGYPGESEGATTPALVNSDTNHQREPNRKRNPQGRIRREQRHEDRDE
jgi:hypothetical protein